MTTKTEEADIHNNAAALIVAAAAKSGLLKEVANALCFRDKYPDHHPSGGFSARELLEQLAEAFDDHYGLPWRVIGTSYSGGKGIASDFPDIDFTEAGLAPYLGKQNDNNTVEEGSQRLIKGAEA